MSETYIDLNRPMVAAWIAAAGNLITMMVTMRMLL